MVDSISDASIQRMIDDSIDFIERKTAKNRRQLLLLEVAAFALGGLTISMLLIAAASTGQNAVGNTFKSVLENISTGSAVVIILWRLFFSRNIIHDLVKEKIVGEKDK